MEWQQAVALALVAASFFWLLRRALRARAGTDGCGGCGGCGTTSAGTRDTGLVQLDDMPR